MAASIAAAEHTSAAIAEFLVIMMLSVVEVYR
jgi:hypothetical protein